MLEVLKPFYDLYECLVDLLVLFVLWQCLFIVHVQCRSLVHMVIPTFCFHFHVSKLITEAHLSYFLFILAGGCLCTCTCTCTSMCWLFGLYDMFLFYTALSVDGFAKYLLQRQKVFRGSLCLQQVCVSSSVIVSCDHTHPIDHLVKVLTIRWGLL